jgi:hypothetical protein
MHTLNLNGSNNRGRALVLHTTQPKALERCKIRKILKQREMVFKFLSLKQKLPHLLNSNLRGM